MTENITRLLNELKRVSKAVEAGDYSAEPNLDVLSVAEAEAAFLITQILRERQAVYEHKLITEVKQAREALLNHECALNILNRAARIIHSGKENSFTEAMTLGLGLIADAADIDRMSVFRNFEEPEGLCVSQILRWSKAAGGLAGVREELKNIPYYKLAPRLEHVLAADECVSGLADRMPDNGMFKRFGCVAVLGIPIFDNGKFWGVALFERLREEEFTGWETEALRSASFMLANAVIRKEKAEMIRQANEQAQLMLDASPLAVTMWDKNFRVIDCSQTALNVFGYSSKQELIEHFVDNAPEYQPCGRRSAEILAEAATEAFQTGICRMEWTGRTVGGEPIVFEDTAVRVKYKNEYALMLYSRDIREEKKMTEEIRRRDGAIQAQAHWYKSILDGIPLPISVTDADMNLVFTNSAATAALNKDPDVLIGRHCSNWNVPICGTDGCSVVRAKQGLKQTFFKYNGLSCQVDTEIIRNSDGETTGYMEILHDVTEIENTARRQADLASEAKSSFLATMSHEMRTPLNAVIGMTEIGRRASGIERKNYALDRIAEASTHLLGVINDILDMSKIEADKLELSNVEFNFERMLQKVITVISYRANEKRQGFAVNVDGKAPDFVIGDDQRLAQIITNLLSNAAKFTPEGGLISLDVSLLNEENGISELKIEVADNGIGISEEQQKRLFGKFSQAESGISREFGGSGLGLAISKRLVEMMGGRIWVESEQGKGSRFIFTVKVQSGAKNLRSLLDPGIQWDTVRVLAADGSGLARRFFKDTFDRMGIDCEIAASSANVCQIIENRGPFNICFIDRHLPDIDGCGLTRRIKTRTGHGLVVLTSASDWETLHGAVKKSGADKGLLKPFLSSALADCLNECMAASPKIKAAAEETGEFAGKTLLLAEDVDINREIVMSLLEGTGLETVCAENGKDALSIMEKESEKYDIVFMDIQMPVMDGLEAARRIRDLPMAWCAEIPIVAMTANVFKESVDECIAAGMDSHIGKPVSSENITAALRKYLNGAESRRKPEFIRRSTEPSVSLTVGTKVSVDIRTYDGRGKMNVLSLPSVVEEIVNEGYFIIQMPLYKGGYYPLPRDEMFLMYFSAGPQNTEEPEMFSLPVSFAEKIERENSEYAGMNPLGKIERSQRRECYRISVSTSVSLKRAAGGEARARTVDFSDGGMLLETDENIGVNERIVLDFNIGGHETVEATVLRSDVSDKQRPGYSIAVKFENPGKEQRERFYSFVKEKQMGKKPRYR